MSETQLQFRVGLFVIVSIAIGIGITFQFGKLETYFAPKYPLGIHFDSASGLAAGTPVRMSGLTIGSVQQISLDRDHGGVLVSIEVLEEYLLPDDSEAELVSSLLGDSLIEFQLGRSQEHLQPGDVIPGILPGNPFEAVDRLEKQVATSLQVFVDTSREWQKVGANLNNVLLTNEGQIDQIVDQAAVALKELTGTLEKASQTLEYTNRMVADPELQRSIKTTLAAMPRMIEQTQQTIAITQRSVSTLGSTMENLRVATEPLAKNSTNVVLKLDAGLNQLNSTLMEIRKFSQTLNEGDGTLQRLTKDPQLYRNLQITSATLASLLQNLEPVLKDVQVFTDKVARHPELLGVSGALKGSSGLKDELPEPSSPNQPRQASGASFNNRIKRN